MGTVTNSKILFIGEFPTTNLIKESQGKIDSLYRDSQAIIAGLREQDGASITVFTVPDIASFPRQKPFIRGFYDSVDDVTSLTLLNLPYIKQLWIPLSIIFSSFRLIRRNKGITTIICPYMVLHHVLAARALKICFGKKVKIITVIPDVFFPKRYLLKLINKYTERLTKKSDAFILYTLPMADYLRIKAKPYLVIEGFNSFKAVESPKQKISKFIVTYTGTLNVNYGIIRLLDAMKFIAEDNINLYLYGLGDAVEIIKQYALGDSRIHFMGQVSKDDALTALYTSSVLVNPRNSTDGEYVQFSFPSKDIEYLSTGIPTVLCRLPSMPIEYNGSYVDAKDGSAEQLAEAIVSVYKMSEGQREVLGRKAQSFIRERMNTKSQGKQIIDLVNRL